MSRQWRGQKTIPVIVHKVLRWGLLHHGFHQCKNISGRMKFIENKSAPRQICTHFRASGLSSWVHASVDMRRPRLCWRGSTLRALKSHAPGHPAAPCRVHLEVDGISPCCPPRVVPRRTAEFPSSRRPPSRHLPSPSLHGIVPRARHDCSWCSATLFVRAWTCSAQVLLSLASSGAASTVPHPSCLGSSFLCMTVISSTTKELEMRLCTRRRPLGLLDKVRLRLRPFGPKLTERSDVVRLEALPTATTSWWVSGLVRSSCRLDWCLRLGACRCSSGCASGLWEEGRAVDDLVVVCRVLPAISARPSRHPVPAPPPALPLRLPSPGLRIVELETAVPLVQACVAAPPLEGRDTRSQCEHL